MSDKSSTAEDDIFEGIVEVKEKPKPKRTGHQEDGSYVTSSGEVLPPKERKSRVPYPEPEEAQVDGNQIRVESPDGKLSFEATRMSKTKFSRAGFPNRKRLDLYYEVTEVYAGKPRKYYSYDELEQLRKGEMKR